MAPWPLPQEYRHGSSVLWLSPNVKLTYREFVEVWKNQSVLQLVVLVFLVLLDR